MIWINVSVPPFTACHIACMSVFSQAAPLKTRVLHGEVTAIIDTRVRFASSMYENRDAWAIWNSALQYNHVRLVVQGVVFNFFINPVSVLRQKFAISLVTLPCVFKIFTAKLSLGFLSKGNFEFFPQNCRWDFQQGKLNIFAAKLSLAIFWHLRSKPRWRFLQ